MFGKSPRAVKSTDGVVVTETAPCQKSLTLQVGREVIAPVRAAVLAEFRKRAGLPGFRKGKVPVEVVERQFAAAIQEETVHRVTQQVLEQAAKDHHLKPVGSFEVKDLRVSDTDGLAFEATVEVEPAFALGTYKGIALKAEAIGITEEELARALAQLQDSMAQLVPSGEGEAKERRVPVLNDELAKDVGFETLQTLREHVRTKLLEQKRTAARQAQEAALCDALLTRHAFEVPSRLISQQTERLTRDFKARLLLSGVAEEQVEAQAGKFTEQLRTSAERHVKLGFILDRIAEAESVRITQDELVERLWQLSRRWQKDPVQVRKLLDAQDLWPSVVSAIRQEKTMALLMKSAVIEDGAGGS